MILYYEYYNVTIELIILLHSNEYIKDTFLNCCSLNIDSKTHLDARCLITDTIPYLCEAYDKVFFCTKEYNDDILKTIPFEYTILYGNDCVNFYNIVPDIFHKLNFSFPIGTHKIKNNIFIMKEYLSKDFPLVYDFFHPLCQSTPESVVFMKDSLLDEQYCFDNHLLSYSFDNTGYYGIFLENELIGQISIIHHAYKEKLQYELSYYIKEEFRHCKLASCFLIMLIEYFYNFHDESEPIYTVIHNSNIISFNFIKKIGFKLLEKMNDRYIFCNSNINL